ncbi:uncharacterized protein LOC103976699 [Musa acuminata AAA Group]|uniref:uncharacterized protein LOC103976699 n=1 Tax=Musa acuminata AAA Group TaxID=214697 RepID=UPI0031CF022D
MEMHIRDQRKLQSISQKQIMGRSEIDGRCRRHPEHRQSRGVCPFCLRDRLSQLSASSSATTTLSSAAATSSPDTNLSSAAASPPSQVHNKGLRLLLKPGPLKKSRSLAFVIGRLRDEDKGKKKEEGKKEKDKKKRKKGGSFWSKMVLGSDRRKEVDGDMLHSRTMKEKIATKWALF